MCSSGTSATSFWVYHRFNSKAGRIRSIIAVALLPSIRGGNRSCRGKKGDAGRVPFSVPGTPRPPLLLLPLPRDVELPLLTPDVHRPLPLDRVPLDRQLVLDGELHVLQLPVHGEGQHPVLHLRVLELPLLLVRVDHHPGQLVPVLLDGQGGL